MAVLASTDRSTTLRATALRTAVAALEAGNYIAAEAECTPLVAAHAEDCEATYLLGLAIAAQERPGSAAMLLERVHHRRPAFRHPAYDALDLLRACGRDAATLALLRASVQQAPGNADLLYALADACHRENDCTGALEPLSACLAIRPDWAAAHVLMGILRHDLGDCEAARPHFAAAAALEPDAAAPWSNLGFLEKTAGRFDAAVAAYGQALARAPSDPRIRLNRAVALLQAGRFAEAWHDFECRFDVRGARLELPEAALLPELCSGVDLQGRTVLVTHEDGFGDTLQFVRYIPLLVQRGAHVVLHVPRPLLRLLKSLEGGAELITGEVSPRFDYACPMMSLPRIFGTTLETIPAATPYLHAALALRAHWATRLPARRGGPRVGLAWSGQARPWAEGFTAGNARRNIPPEALAPLASLHAATWVSLQVGDAPPLPGCLAAHDPTAEVTDFADTAAIVENLDVVVSVDTSVAHLAGALGKPVFLLDRYDNCWRWLAGRTDSSWYPSMRIFRQSRPSDWAPVVEAVAAELARGATLSIKPS